MRVRAIDWLRGLVMVLMTVDHAGNVFDAAHMHGDSAAHWVVGASLPAGEFLTRWVTHLCAPVFILLAGASLAMSVEKRRDDRSVLGATAFFFYVLHVHLMAGFEALAKLDRNSAGLARTWAAAGVTVLLLLPLCALYRRYKATHPNGWTRYV